MKTREPNSCIICGFKPERGLELHYLFEEKKYSYNDLAVRFEPDYMKNYRGHRDQLPASIIKHVIRRHLEKKHIAPWYADFEEFKIKRANDLAKANLSGAVSRLEVELSEGRISDEAFLEKIKALAYANAILDPSKVTVKRGLEAIKLTIEKEKVGVQKSESLRNWMKLISGKPDKETSATSQIETVEGETVEPSN